MIHRLTLTAPIAPYTSYGILAIQFARGIEEQTRVPRDDGLDGHLVYVPIRPISVSEAWGSTVPTDIRTRFVSGPQPEPWELLLHPPDFSPTPGKQTAWFTMFESTRLPPMGPELLNRAQLVIVPSEWNACTFNACGVDAPIRTCPLGIDTELFKYRAEPVRIRDKVVFGAAGRMAHGGVRKGIDEVIECFTQAFPYEKDVKLTVKLHPDCTPRPVKDERIEIIQAHLTDEQLVGWYEGIHCFVSAARAEGWGLMQQQAMSVGRPIISIWYGGLREFWNRETGYEVPYRLRPAQGAYKGCGLWAEPDQEAIVAAMRMVYHDKSRALRLGAEASKSVAHFSVENSNKHLVKLLRDAGALPTDGRLRMMRL